MSQTTDAPNKLVSGESPWPACERVVRRTTTAVSRSAAAVVNLIFPPTCQLCWQDIDGPDEVHICAACRGELRNRKPLCSACAMPLPNLASPVADSCPACRNERFRFTSVQAVGLYEGLLRDDEESSRRGAHADYGTITGRNGPILRSGEARFGRAGSHALDNGESRVEPIQRRFCRKSWLVTCGFQWPRTSCVVAVRLGSKACYCQTSGVETSAMPFRFLRGTILRTLVCC